MYVSYDLISRDRVYLIMNNNRNRLIIFAGLTTMSYKIKKKWSKSRISYYSNSVTSFNHMELVLCLVVMSIRCLVQIIVLRKASLYVLLGDTTDLLHGVEIHLIVYQSKL